MNLPVTPKPNDKLVQAEFEFGKGKPIPKELPTFTVEDLSDMGVRFLESDDTKLIEVPLLTQKKLLESLKAWGFGASHALDLLVKKILDLYGLNGRVKTRIDEKTFSWFAFLNKKEGATGTEGCISIMGAVGMETE